METTQLEQNQGTAYDQLSDILDGLAGRDLIDWLNEDCLEIVPIRRGEDLSALEVLYTYGGPTITITFTEGNAEIERHWGSDSDDAYMGDPIGVFEQLAELY